MDQKAWLWRKRSSEKTILATGDEAPSAELGREKEPDPENSVKCLNEKLATVLDECSEKDKMVHKFEKMAEEAAEDKHKAEEEMLRFKQELNEAKQEKVLANERLVHLNSALKDSMIQLNRVREEQDKRMHAALEEKLSGTSKKLADLTVESSYLSKALAVKEKLIEDLTNSQCQTEAEFKTLIARLDSVEKENSFLRYQFRLLEKELGLRDEELEYARRSAEVYQKQSLENVKKVKKLEAECQRLRSMTRKRLPEVEGRAQIDARRRNGAIRGGDSRNECCAENTSQQLGFLIDQIKDLEKENKTLKESLSQKDEEIIQFQKLNSSSHVNSLASVPDTSLMDDFIEMEKMAIVAVDTSPSSLKEKPGNGFISTNMELVPAGQVEFSDGDSEKRDDWLQTVTKVVLKECEVSKRSLDELFRDIRLAVHSKMCTQQDKLLPISGYIAWKSHTSSSTGATFEESNDEFLHSESNRSAVRDEFKKHLGGDGPGTALELECVQSLMLEMEKLYGDFQVEIHGLKNELNFIKSSKIDLGGSGLQQSQQKMETLQLGVEQQLTCIADDEVENQKLMNDDLETQLSVTRAKLNEVLQKLSSVEVELDNKTHCCEELEGMCVELQLQLQSNSHNRPADGKENQELLQTGVEITKASAKLAECEQTILKLGKQLKQLGSAKEMSVVDKVLSMTGTNSKRFRLRPSLRQILSEDSVESQYPESPKTKEVISTSKPGLRASRDLTPAHLGLKQDSKGSKEGALVIYPSKGKRGRLGFLRRLIVRKQNATSKNATLYLGR